MLKRRHLAIGFLAFCLTATLLVGVTSSVEYDPWMDTNDDGLIDIVDIVNLAIRFGEEGTPINKAELLLELQERVPRAGNISVPAGAFVPYSSAAEWRVYGGTIYNYEASSNVAFFAAVQLPHGATVTNFTTYWYDASYLTVSCWLDSRNSQGSAGNIASAHSTGDAGHGSSTASSINPAFATVDNNKYGYTLELMIPASATHEDYQFHLALIEYEYQ